MATHLSKRKWSHAAFAGRHYYRYLYLFIYQLVDFSANLPMRVNGDLTTHLKEDGHLCIYLEGMAIYLFIYLGGDSQVSSILSVPIFHGDSKRQVEVDGGGWEQVQIGGVRVGPRGSNIETGINLVFQVSRIKILFFIKFNGEVILRRAGSYHGEKIIKT